MVSNKEHILALYETKRDEMSVYLKDIYDIIVNSGSPLEGNCFYIGSLDIRPELFNKQANLFWCGSQAKKRICEIGFNAGHSTLLMLMGRENKLLDYTIFDIGHHPYTKPSLEYIQSKFPYVNFEYIEGDSTIEMPKWIHKNKNLLETYDVVHVDGGHSEHCIIHDMKNADKLVCLNGIIIIDDTNVNYINTVVNVYLNSGNYEELILLEQKGCPHRIIRKIKKNSYSIFDIFRGKN